MWVALIRIFCHCHRKDTYEEECSSHDVTVVDDNYSIIKQRYEYSLKAVNPS